MTGLILYDSRKGRNYAGGSAVSPGKQAAARAKKAM